MTRTRMLGSVSGFMRAKASNALSWSCGDVGAWEIRDSGKKLGVGTNAVARKMKTNKKLQASLNKTSGIPNQATGNRRKNPKQPTSNPLEQKPEKKRVIKAEGKNSKNNFIQPATGASQQKQERDERAK